MNRYGKYFVNHTLWLDDGFSNYYLQGITMDPQQIQDVESVVFNWPEEAEQWINQCMAFEPAMTLRKLRGFLTECCMENYSVHEMSQSQVIREAARQLCRQSLRLVIEPKMGWAVQVDPETAEPVQPVSVEPEPEPDLEKLLAELKIELDTLVAQQQKNSDRIADLLAEMNDAQTAAFYSKKAGAGVWDATGGGLWGMAKAAGSLYVNYLKTVGKIALTPGKMTQAATQSIMTGSTSPLEAEINKIVRPVAQTYEQAQQYKSMLTILFSEPMVYELLYDFAERYYKATHNAELTKIGAAAVTDVLVTILLAIFTAGTGAVANIAAKFPRLAKIFNLLEKITNTLKRIGPQHRLPKTRKSASLSGGRKKSKPGNKKGGVPDPKTPKKKTDVENKGKKEYLDKDNNDGPKKTKNYKKEKFKTNGLDVATRRQYLESPDGQLMQQMLKDADPGKPDYVYKARADDLLKSGKDIPAKRTVQRNESLYKLVKNGEQPSQYTPYWVTESELAELRRNPTKLADRLGLPNDSVSPSGQYSVWETKPAIGKEPTIFESTIAPTVEGGTIRTGGGAQALILNRQEWQQPVLNSLFP